VVAAHLKDVEFRHATEPRVRSRSPRGVRRADGFGRSSLGMRRARSRSSCVVAIPTTEPASVDVDSVTGIRIRPLHR